MRKLGILLSTLSLLALQLGCGDQYRPVANPIVGQGGQPQFTHFAFVVNSNPIGNSSTMRIDVSGDTNLETQAVGAGASGESFLANTAGALLTANSLADSVSIFNTVQINGQVTTINVPIGSRPIKVTTARAGVAYSLNNQPNANCPSTGSISVIDTTALAAISTVCVGVNPVAFAQLPNGTNLYVANRDDNTVSVYDPSLGGIATTITQGMGLGQHPVYITPSSDSTFVFVVNAGDGNGPGTLNIITSSNNQVVASLSLGVLPSFSYLDTHLNRLYVVNTGSNSVTVFDVANLNLANNPPLPTLGTSNVGSAPVGVTALQDGTRFYVANSESNDVSVVSATSFLVLKTIPVGQKPVWIAADPGSTKVYSANHDSGTISIIQTVNDAVVNNMPAPPQNPTCSSGCALQQPSMILTF